MQTSRDTIITRTISEASLRDLLQQIFGGDPAEIITDVQWVEQGTGNYCIVKTVIAGTVEGSP